MGIRLLPLILILAIVALVSGSAYYTLLVTLVVVSAIMASSYGLQAGWVGLDNLAIGGIALLGGYITVYLVTHNGLNFFPALGMSAVLCGLTGLALVYPSFRIKGGYFAVVTLLVQLVLTEVFTDWTSFTGGSEGLSAIPFPSVDISGYHIVFQGTSLALLCLGFLAAWLYVVSILTTGKSKMRLIAARDDEDLAEHLGINVTNERLKIFFVSALAAGIAGGIYASVVSYIAPDVMDVFFSFNVMVMAYLGGRRWLWGPVIGAAVITLLPYGFTSTIPLQEYATGLILIVTIVFFPRGIMSIGERFSQGRKVQTPNTPIRGPEEPAHTDRPAEGGP